MTSRKLNNITRTQATIALRVIVACGVSVSNAAHANLLWLLRRRTGRWKPRLLCGSHTGCLHAESVLAWLAACWWSWGVCLRLSQGARK